MHVMSAMPEELSSTGEEKALDTESVKEEPVSGDDEILIGKSGKVHGKIIGGIVLVAGYVEGDLSIQGHLEIASTGNVEGEIQVPAGKLVIHEGAKITGQCVLTLTNQSFPPKKN